MSLIFRFSKIACSVRRRRDRDKRITEQRQSEKRRAHLWLLQVRSDFGELGERRLKVFDDFGSDDVGGGEVGAVFEAFVFEPEPSR